MKNLSKFFLILTLFFGCNVFSQTSTEKWNSGNSRYEYFDSYGNMTGYKEYNSSTGSWDYYAQNQRPKPRLNQYNPVVNPVNTELIGQVLAAKEARYNANEQKIKNEIENIGTYVNNLDIDEDIKAIILKRHFNEYVNTLNKKRYDFSSSNLTSQIINFFYEGINKITKEETSK